jgi:hypothetical protein
MKREPAREIQSAPGPPARPLLARWGVGSEGTLIKELVGPSRRFSNFPLESPYS